MPKTQYEGDERRVIEPPGWHLDKKVPITLIVILATQLGAGFVAFLDLKKDVELLKADNLTLHATDSRHTQEAKEDRQIMREALATLTAKIDRLIERSAK